MKRKMKKTQINNIRDEKGSQQIPMKFGGS
jgi:hypothetical protein